MLADDADSGCTWWATNPSPLAWNGPTAPLGWLNPFTPLLDSVCKMLASQHDPAGMVGSRSPEDLYLPCGICATASSSAWTCCPVGGQRAPTSSPAWELRPLLCQGRRARPACPCHGPCLRTVAGRSTPSTLSVPSWMLCALCRPHGTACWLSELQEYLRTSHLLLVSGCHHTGHQ